MKNRGLTVMGAFKAGLFIKGKHIFIALLIFTSCFNISAERKNEVRHDPYWNEISMFLAGLPVGKESRLWGKTQEGFYKNHMASMDEFWARVRKDTLEIMEPWRKANIPAGMERNPVFYPLSGADFVNLFTLFPGAGRYLMVALEDPGEIPDPMNLDNRGLESGLASIRNSTHLYGKINYFQTRVMIKELKNLNIKGVTPILMIFISRMGLTVQNIQKIGIDDDGRAAELDMNGNLNGKKPKFPGTLISFQRPGDLAPRELVYLSMKLEKDTVSPSSPPGKFFNGYLSGANTMIKAGCYIFFIDKFKEVMDYILNKSSLVIQDDSGIPYNAFKNDLWNLKFYGVYIPQYPISDTAVYKQEDLMREYKKGSLPLPFNFGYGSLLGKNKSNLMIAEKKEVKKKD